MSLFDKLVEQVIAQNTDYPVLRTVIEKELLHKLVSSFLEGEDDFNEELKFEYLLASADGEIGFNE
jgi:hypothetical protein